MGKKIPKVTGKRKQQRTKNSETIEVQRQRAEKRLQKAEERLQRAEKQLQKAKKRREKRAERLEKRKNRAWYRFCARVWAWLRGLPWKKAISWLTFLPWRQIGRTAWRFSKRHLAPAVALLICVGLGVAAFALILSAAVCDKASDRIKTADELLASGEQIDCIIVLGCAVYREDSGWRLSHMLSDRVETATQLYHKGVSAKLLMSGDNQNADGYNEVDPMRRQATEWGVPMDAIDVDRLGLSTYDSLARIAEQYKGRRVVIVTQRYHLYRALYIAEKLGLDAYGVSADLRTYAGRVNWEAREVLARCKDVWYVEKRPAAAGMES